MKIAIADDITDNLIASGRFIICNHNVAVNLEWVEDISNHKFIFKNTEHI